MLADKESEIEKRLKQQAEQFKQQTETLELQFKALSETNQEYWQDRIHELKYTVSTLLLFLRTLFERYRILRYGLLHQKVLLPVD